MEAPPNVAQQRKVDLGKSSVVAPPLVRLRIAYAEDGAGWARRLASVLDDMTENAESPIRLEIAVSQTSGPTMTKVAGFLVPADAIVLVATRRMTAEGVHRALKDRQEARRHFTLRVAEPAWDDVDQGVRLPVDGPPLDLREDAEEALADAGRNLLSDLTALFPPVGNQDEEPSSAAEPVSVLAFLRARDDISDDVATIIADAARATASAGGAAAVDTVALLLALHDAAPAGGDAERSADWARRALASGMEGVRSRDRSVPSRSLHPSVRPPVAASVGAALDRAGTIAAATTGERTIHPRHLLAALLTDASDDGPLPLLAAAGLDPAALRARFFDFVRDRGEDDGAWRRALVGVLSEAPRHSAFHADDSRSDDFLDIMPDVLAFAGLIASRTVKPPLSIGLFGAWGSGKTFFMHALRREIGRLAATAEASDDMQRDLAFYRRIVQIEFNAWHYVEENLWASLATRIFEALHLAERPSEGRQLHDRLSAAVSEETRRAEEAERDRHGAEKEVAAARRELEEAQQAFASRADRRVLAGIDLTDVRRVAAAALAPLGLEQKGTSAAALRDELGQARRELEGWRGVAAPLRHGSNAERIRYGAALALGIAAVPAVGALFALVLGAIGQDAMRIAGASIAGAATLVTTGGTWIRSQRAVVARWREEVDRVRQRVDARVVEEYERVAVGSGALAEREDAARRAEAGLDVARRRVAEAEARLRGASLSEVLTTFVAERAGSGEYRRQLSTLAQVREDLDRLSSLIEEENWRLDPPVPGEDVTRRPLPKFATLEDELRHRATRVNRIVLYIDDLDRCPPAKVVEVLQAVHLLLAFPLFVVVVGVDARWVTRSIETRYRELLRADGRAGASLQELTGSASAEDYLEKIFQVPFWLRPMSDGASRRMVEGLLASSLVDDDDELTPGATGVVAVSRGGTESEGIDRDVEADGEGADARGLPAVVSGGPASDGPARDEAPDPPEPARERLAPETLTVGTAELRFMRALAPLLGRSPRALKRFVNVYRLVKAGLTREEHEAFVQDEPGEFRAVLFLLAVDTGAPDAAVPLLAELKAATHAPPGLVDLISRVDDAAEGVQEWERVRAWLEREGETHRFDGAVSTLMRAARWVGRYSFHAGRIALAEPEPDGAPPRPA